MIHFAGKVMCTNKLCVDSWWILLLQLQEVTHDVHYENYRSQRLAKGGGQPTSSSSSAPGLPPPPTPRRAMDEKDKQLLEKEAELRRMQEMVAAMQEQIKQQSVSSLQSLVSNPASMNQ